MALGWQNGTRARVADDIHARLLASDATDQHFDETCDWPRGRTREFIRQERTLDFAEVLEIAMRLGHPIARYIYARYTPNTCIHYPKHSNY
jgi:hypothetical protein